MPILADELDLFTWYVNITVLADKKDLNFFTLSRLLPVKRVLQTIKVCVISKSCVLHSTPDGVFISLKIRGNNKVLMCRE